MSANDVIIQNISGYTITVKVRGVVREIDLLDLFEIDDADLAKEYAHQASLYAFFSALQVAADFSADNFKLTKEKEYSLADLDIRDDAENTGKKITEPQVKAMASLDAKVISLSEKELVARYDAKLLKAIVEALKMRADMLVSLGAHQRHELDQTGMNIKEASYKKMTDDAKKAITDARLRK